MRPRLVSTLALCSMACSVALGGLWARSYWREDGVLRHSESGLCWSVATSRGHVVVGWQRFSPKYPMWQWSSAPARPVDLVPGVVGAEPGTAWFPIAAPVVLCLIPPVAWAWLRKRRGARGFDVGMTAESDRRTDR